MLINPDAFESATEGAAPRSTPPEPRGLVDPEALSTEHESLGAERDRYSTKDADTFRDHQDEVNVRETGYDAFETAKWDNNGHPLGDLATDVASESLDAGATIRQTGRQDKWDRELGAVTRANGEPNSEFMIRQGLGSATQWSTQREFDQEVAGLPRRMGVFEGMQTDEEREIAARREAVLEQSPPQLSFGHERSGASKGNTWNQSIARGMAQLGANTHSFGHAVADQMGFEGTAERRLEDKARYDLRAAAVPAKVRNFREVDFQNVGTYAIEAIGENLPNLLASIVGGAAAVATGGLAGAGMAAAGGAALRGAVGKAATRFMLGATASGYVMNTGEVQKEFLDHGIDASQTALVAGIPMTLFDAVGLASVIGPMMGVKTDAALAVLKASGGPFYKELIKQSAKRGAKGMAIGTAGEMPTESLQEMTILLARAYEDPTFELFSQENIDRVIEAGIKGGISGGATAGAGSTARGAVDFAVERSEARLAEIAPDDSLSVARTKLNELSAKREGRPPSLEDGGQMDLPGLEPGGPTPNMAPPAPSPERPEPVPDSQLPLPGLGAAESTVVPTPEQIANEGQTPIQESEVTYGEGGTRWSDPRRARNPAGVSGRGGSRKPGSTLKRRLRSASYGKSTVSRMQTEIAQAERRIADLEAGRTETAAVAPAQARSQPPQRERGGEVAGHLDQAGDPGTGGLVDPERMQASLQGEVGHLDQAGDPGIGGTVEPTHQRYEREESSDERFDETEAAVQSAERYPTASRDGGASAGAHGGSAAALPNTRSSSPLPEGASVPAGGRARTGAADGPSRDSVEPGATHRSSDGEPGTETADASTASISGRTDGQSLPEPGRSSGREESGSDSRGSRSGGREARGAGRPRAGGVHHALTDSPGDRGESTPGGTVDPDVLVSSLQGTETTEAREDLDAAPNLETSSTPTPPTAPVGEPGGAPTPTAPTQANQTEEQAAAVEPQAEVRDDATPTAEVTPEAETQASVTRVESLGPHLAEILTVQRGKNKGGWAATSTAAKKLTSDQKAALKEAYGADIPFAQRLERYQADHARAKAAQQSTPTTNEQPTTQTSAEPTAPSLATQSPGTVAAAPATPAARRQQLAQTRARRAEAKPAAPSAQGKATTKRRPYASAKAEPYDPRLKNDEYRAPLNTMFGEVHAGGNSALVRDSDSSATRTASENPPWFKEGGFRTKDVETAVQKVAAEEPLTATEANVITRMLDTIDEDRMRHEPESVEGFEGPVETVAAPKPTQSVSPKALTAPPATPTLREQQATKPLVPSAQSRAADQRPINGPSTAQQPVPRARPAVPSAQSKPVALSTEHEVAKPAVKLPVRREAKITRKMVQSEPDAKFVFGDNLEGTGFGGQAEAMRGEPNAIGIPTKHRPGRKKEDYFAPDDFPKVKPRIDEAFAALERHVLGGGRVVAPKEGVGSGLANLKVTAPNIHDYIARRLETLEQMAPATLGQGPRTEHEVATPDGAQFTDEQAAEIVEDTARVDNAFWGFKGLDPSTMTVSHEGKTLTLPDLVTGKRAQIDGVDIPSGLVFKALRREGATAKDVVEAAELSRVYGTRDRPVVRYSGVSDPKASGAQRHVKPVHVYPLMDHSEKAQLFEVAVDREAAINEAREGVNPEKRRETIEQQYHRGAERVLKDLEAQNAKLAPDDQLVVAGYKGSHVFVMPRAERDALHAKLLGDKHTERVKEDANILGRIGATISRIGGHSFVMEHLEQIAKRFTNKDNDGTLAISNRVPGGLAQGTLIFEHGGKLYVNKGTVRGQLRLLDEKGNVVATEEEAINSGMLFGRTLEQAIASTPDGVVSADFHLTQLDTSSGAKLPLQALLGDLVDPVRYIRLQNQKLQAEGVRALASPVEKKFMEYGLPANIAMAEKSFERQVKQFTVPAVRDYAMASDLVPKGHVAMLPGTLASYMREAGLAPGNPPRIGDTVILHREPSLPTGTGTVAFKFAGVMEFTGDNVTQDRGLVVNPHDPALSGMGMDFDGDRIYAIAPHEGFELRSSHGSAVTSDLTRMVKPSPKPLSDEEIATNPAAQGDHVAAAMLRDFDGLDARVGEAINQATKLLEVGATGTNWQVAVGEVAQAMISSVKKAVDRQLVKEGFASAKAEVKAHRKENEQFLTESLSDISRRPVTERNEAVAELVRNLQRRIEDQSLRGVQPAIAERAILVAEANRSVAGLAGMRELPVLIQEAAEAQIAATPEVEHGVETVQAVKTRYKDLSNQIAEAMAQDEAMELPPSQPSEATKAVRRQRAELATVLRAAVESGQVSPAAVIAHGPSRLITSVLTPSQFKGVYNGKGILGAKVSLKSHQNGEGEQGRTIPAGEYQVVGTPEGGIALRRGREKYEVVGVAANKPWVHDFLTQSSRVMVTYPNGETRYKTATRKSAKNPDHFLAEFHRLAGPSRLRVQGLAEGDFRLRSWPRKLRASVRPRGQETGQRVIGDAPRMARVASALASMMRAVGMPDDLTTDVVQSTEVGALRKQYEALGARFEAQLADQTLPRDAREVLEHDLGVLRGTIQRLRDSEGKRDPAWVIYNNDYINPTLRVPILIFQPKGVKWQTQVNHIAHELGHLVQAWHFDQASDATKRAVIDGFTQDIKAGRVTRFVNPADAFSEWYAEQFREYLAGVHDVTKGLRTDMVGRFFGALAVKLRRLWSQLRRGSFLNESFAQYMDGAIFQMRQTPIQKQARRDTVAMADHPFLPQRAPGMPLQSDWTPMQRTQLVRAMEQVKETGINLADVITANTIRPMGSWLTSRGPTMAQLSRLIYRDTDSRVDRTGQEGAYLSEWQMHRGRIWKLSGMEKALDPLLKSGTGWTKLTGQSPGLDTKSELYNRVMDHLIDEVDVSSISDPREAEIVAGFRPAIAAARRYGRERLGLKIPNRKNYFPVVVDYQRWESSRDAVIEALMSAKDPKNPNGPSMTREVAIEVYEDVLNSEGVWLDQNQDQMGHPTSKVAAPGFTHARHRKWEPHIKEALRDYQLRDISGTLHNYTTRLAKRGTVHKMFGGSRLDDAGNYVYDPLMKINDLVHKGRALGELKPHDYRHVVDHVIPAIFGQLGIHGNPMWRKLSVASVTYTNLRLLPFVLFSSLVDPSVIMGRQGVKTAWRGIRDFIATQDKSELRGQLEVLGLARSDLTENIANDQLGGMYMGGQAQKINETFFRLNGMHAWTNMMRSIGLTSAKHFIKDRVEATDRTQLRELANLGLSTGQVRSWVNEGMPVGDDRHRAINNALIQLVDDSVIRPNAMLRAWWANDPRFMMLAHLKSFAWSFYERALKHVWTEAVQQWGERQGAQKAMALIPAASLMIPALLLGMLGYEMRRKLGWLGDVPPHLEKDGLDYYWELVQRAGLVGPMQFAIDADRASDMGRVGLISLLGPQADQFQDLSEGLDYAFWRALPGMNQMPVVRSWANREVW